MAVLNNISLIEVFDICVDLKLNYHSKLQACEVFLILIKDELVDNYHKLIGKLDHNNIIISNLTLKITFKVNEALINY